MTPTKFEDWIKELIAQGLVHNQKNEVVAKTIDVYGRELHARFMRWFQDTSIADELMSIVHEKLVVRITSFRGDSSLRTWLHRVAKNAAYDYQQQLNKAREEVDVNEVILTAAGQRTSTPPWRRTSKRRQTQWLVSKLTEPERQLLILRVHKKLSWRKIAGIFESKSKTTQVGSCSEPALRKRFERLKLRLRELVMEASAIGDTDDE